MKVLIFDSGTLINLSMNGLLDILEKLKTGFQGKFVITKAVKYEIIDRPLGIERFELGALRIRALLDSGILEMSSSLVADSHLEKETQRILDLGNHYLQARGKWISLMNEAEASCLALSSELSRRGIENIIAIDERTTRVLGENPDNLQQLMSDKLHQRVEILGNITPFSIYKFIRSSELVYVAYKKDIINLKGDKVLEALLYATKFKGSAISFEEINILKKF